MFTASLEIDPLLLAFLLCVKHTDWRDEREWRLLLLADHEQAHQNRVVPFERTAVTRVFLGPRISVENEKAIRDAASSHTPEIPVFKRHLDPDLAFEEPIGFEPIHTFDQFLYWMGGRQ
jgi:hypothetical protein